MSLDNATPTEIATEIERAEEVTVDVYGAMSDRDLLEYIARNIDAALTIAHTIQEQVGPVVEKFSKNPLFGGLFRG